MGRKKLKVIIAMDSFKGSLTSMEAGNAVAAGIRRVYSDADILVKPIADGGEGFINALTGSMNGTLRKVTVTGPGGKEVNACYGIIKENTAVIEMAEAAGLNLVSGKERNPLYTTTYGVGELIRDAIQEGCRRFLVGIGGSATNDGGAGMLQALGYRFLDGEGKDIPFGAYGLKNLACIQDGDVMPELKECTFQIACDVKNPLCGRTGCSAVFGPQKGADKETVLQMDQWLSDYARLAAENYPKADAEKAGTGAAGGMGFAFLTFMNARLMPGIDILIRETGLSEAVCEADYVITGEGRLDAQSIMGKTPVGVAELAGKYDKPVIAFAGSVSRDAGVCNEYGIDAIFPVLRSVTTLEEAMKKEEAEANLSDTAEQVFRLIRLKNQ